MKIPRSTQEMIPVKHILNDGTFVLDSGEYQSAPDRDVLAEMFSLSEAQKQALAKEQYGTGLIKVGSTIVPFENDFPTDNPLYQLMSTKPSDGWGQEVNEHYDV